MPDNLTSKELLPCPFCAGAGRLINSAGCWFVTCDDCDADTGWRESSEDATALWNARASVEPPAATIDPSAALAQSANGGLSLRGESVAVQASAFAPPAVPRGLPTLFRDIRHLLGRLAECFDESEEELRDIRDMISELCAQPFCPKCGPAVMSSTWRCCKCGADMSDGLPPIAYRAAHEPVATSSNELAHVGFNGDPHGGDITDCTACRSDDHLTRFSAWLVQQMPAGTVIGNPHWWAPKILAAACVTAPEAPTEEVPVGTLEYRWEQLTKALQSRLGIDREDWKAEPVEIRILAALDRVRHAEPPAVTQAYIDTVEMLHEVEQTLIDLGWHKDRGVLQRVTQVLDAYSRNKAGTSSTGDGLLTPTPRGRLPNSLGNEHLYEPDQEWMNAPMGAPEPPPALQRLIDEGWTLTVSRRDGALANGPYVAQIDNPQPVIDETCGHCHSGRTLADALRALDEYVTAVTKSEGAS